MKAVKYILLGLAPLVLIVGLWMFMRGGGDGVRISPKITMVDVVTGEVVTMRRDEVVMVPAFNKRDGKPTLYPIDEREDGSIVISDRFHDVLRDFAKNEKVVVDLKTFTVTPAGR